MGNILIKGILTQDGRKDILIKENIIAKIADTIDIQNEPATVVDGKNKAVLPGFVNMHTHSAMTLMRGVNEDSHLHEWLDIIWKMEPRLDEELIYWGTKLACLEMIKTGTTTFNDQYWMIDTAVKAVSDMGLRSLNPYVFLDLFDQ
ncbi:MAG: amidohydrolase family protein, partial [Bacteroidales bacterium]|nr:amidohydrolase family protein [Bacteroidales bacterium]